MSVSLKASDKFVSQNITLIPHHMTQVVVMLSVPRVPVMKQLKYLNHFVATVSVYAMRLSSLLSSEPEHV